MKRYLAPLLFSLCLAPSFAQVPPPVPALPDAERRTSYSITASTCACSVGFALYGDSSNIDAWIEVWVGGTRYLSTDTAHGWSLSSTTGPLASIARPITNAVLTFAAAQTGVVQIVGARRPIRASQFNENQGVPARNLNQVLTDIVAQNRETWDRTNDVTGRALLTKPGDTIGQLPVAASRASTALGFDSAGNPIPLSPSLGIGTIIGPSSSVDGHVLCFNGTSGQLAKDCGPSVGTVLSVGLSMPGIFNVTGSPITGTGTLTAALATQAANSVWAGPTTGSAASPAFRALVGADLPLPGASSLGGIFSKAAVTSNWLRSLGTDGALTASQPAFTDISGTIAAAQLPNPSASTLGGVQSYAAVINQWINTISTSGVPSSTQPGFSNLSGALAASQMPALTGDITTSAGAVATTIAANAVTNAKSAQMGAATLKCNPTNATANAQDCTIQGLTARGTPDAVNDKIPLFDNAAGTIKFVTPNQIASASTAGVSSLNGLSGGLSIAPGNGISVSAAGSNVTVSSASGVASNFLNSQTSNYTVATGDCGKTIQAGTGTTGLFTITLPSISGFSSVCTVRIVNGDSTRGKILSGFPSPYGPSPSNILWPSQSTEVSIVNGVWAITSYPGPWTLTGSQNWQVNRTSGSNTNNDCLSAGAPCATITYAAALIQNQINCNGNAPTIQVAAVTFTEEVNLRGTACVGFLELFITGVGGQPVWTCPAAASCLNVRDSAIVVASNFKLVAAGASSFGFVASQFGVIDFISMEFGSFPSGTHMLIYQLGSMNYGGGTYVVSGSMSNHVSMQGPSQFVGPGGTISVPNALTFTNWFLIQGPALLQQAAGYSGTGAGAGSTGKKYDISLNGVALTGGATQPGASAGTTATGGQWN